MSLVNAVKFGLFHDFSGKQGSGNGTMSGDQILVELRNLSCRLCISVESISVDNILHRPLELCRV